MNIRSGITYLLLMLAACDGVVAADAPSRQPGTDASFQIQEISRGFGVPWGMAFVSATEILITERAGKIILLNIETGNWQNVSGAPSVWAKGQGGLLDIVVAPAINQDRWIYFTYSKAQNGKGVTTLARAKLSKLALEQWQDLLVTHSATSSGRHFGSRIAFDESGHVFFTVGDRGHRPNGQDLGTHAGSVLRLNLDGSIPGDNPFVQNPQAQAAIWSYGHRNPQGISYDRQNRRLWIIEHGPRGGDEINLILPGRNYGWPVISYGKEYWGPVHVGEGTEKEGMEQPVKHYIPSIAPGSLLLYTGKAFPAWQGNLLAGALKLRHINRIVLDDQGKAIAEERLLESLDERIRALIQGPDGLIYFSTDSGRILRLVPAAQGRN